MYVCTFINGRSCLVLWLKDNLFVLGINQTCQTNLLLIARLVMYQLEAELLRVAGSNPGGDLKNAFFQSTDQSWMFFAIPFFFIV